MQIDLFIATARNFISIIDEDTSPLANIRRRNKFTEREFKESGILHTSVDGNVNLFSNV